MSAFLDQNCSSVPDTFYTPNGVRGHGLRIHVGHLFLLTDMYWDIPLVRPSALHHAKQELSTDHPVAQFRTMAQRIKEKAKMQLLAFRQLLRIEESHVEMKQRYNQR